MGISFLLHITHYFFNIHITKIMKIYILGVLAMACSFASAQLADVTGVQIQLSKEISVSVSLDNGDIALTGINGSVDIKYAQNGRLLSIGPFPVTYSSSNRLEKIGTHIVSYKPSGRVNQIGDVSITYTSSGRLENVGGAQIVYGGSNRLEQVVGSLPAGYSLLLKFED